MHKLYPVIIVFILLFFPSYMLAQEFEVRKFEADPADLAARRFEKKTVNDEICALVKVVTNIPGMKFDSNIGIVSVEKKEDGFWVYIAPRERRIRLMADGYLAKDVSMPEPAQSSMVYSMIVATTGVSASEMIPVNFIIEDHSDAVLTVNGEVRDQQETIMLGKGVHEITINKPGYKSIEEDIQVDENNNLFRYELEGLVEQKVTIRSEPTGATVYIDNISRGTTTFQGFIFPGTYQIRLVREEYKDIEGEVTVREGENNEFIYTMERFAGNLVLETEPSDVSITINQKNYTGQENIVLSPGIYRVILSKKGYYTKEERFTIEESENTFLTINLEQITGDMRFITNQPYAEFKLYDDQENQVDTWTGINQIRDIPIGDYSYVGSLDGYSDIRGNFTVEENQQTQVNAEFTVEQQLEYQREQQRKKLAQERARQQEQERLEELRERERLAKLEEERAKQERRNRWKTPDAYTGYCLTYTALSLDTQGFSDNITSSPAGSFAFFFTSRWWGMNMNIGIGSLVLNDYAGLMFNTENNVTALISGISTGPKVRLGPVDVFAFGGWEGNLLFSEIFEEEEVAIGDFIVEFGGVLMPRNWSIGIKYSYALPLNVTNGYPLFTRQEIGLVFK